MNKYVSSITSRYGDIENIHQDAKTVNEILSRQGSKFLIDCMAENAGRCAIKFKLNNQERQNIINSMVKDLQNALEERL